jgi:hypothetical protein
MRARNKNEKPNGARASLWSLLLNTIYFTLFCIVGCIGYFLLEGPINDIINQKKYSDEELELLSKKAMMSLSLEKEKANWDKVVDGIHIRTGFYDDPNLKTVIASCTSCHSAKLVTQNRATRAGWKSMIVWMQETQGLPDLGKSEPIILDYLAKYYAPKATGRRKNIDVDAIDWYVLNIDDTSQ